MKIPLKPGHTTTEFWTVIAAGLSLTGLSAFSLLDAQWAALGVTVLTMVYNGSRSKLKQIQAQAEASAAEPQSAAPKP
jgi:hypothetical protein